MLEETRIKILEKKLAKANKSIGNLYKEVKDLKETNKAIGQISTISFINITSLLNLLTEEKNIDEKNFNEVQTVVSNQLTTSIENIEKDENKE